MKQSRRIEFINQIDSHKSHNVLAQLAQKEIHLSPVTETRRNDHGGQSIETENFSFLLFRFPRSKAHHNLR